MSGLCRGMHWTLKTAPRAAQRVHFSTGGFLVAGLCSGWAVSEFLEELLFWIFAFQSKSFWEKMLEDGLLSLSIKNFSRALQTILSNTAFIIIFINKQKTRARAHVYAYARGV